MIKMDANHRSQWEGYIQQLNEKPKPEIRIKNYKLLIQA